MIWIIIGGIVAYFLFWLLIGRKGDDEFRIMEVLVICVAVLIVIFGGQELTAHFTTPEYNLSEEYQLANIHDDTLSDGYFFLGTGSVNEERCFFYCYEEDGGWKIDSVEADIAIIFEEGRDDGELLVYKPTLLSHLWSFGYEDKYEFYIPEGSIIREYEVR